MRHYKVKILIKIAQIKDSSGTELKESTWWTSDIKSNAFSWRFDIDGESSYSVERVGSHHIMQLIAFASSLIQVLHQGVQTFNRSRYRQFVKRIGRLIRYKNKIKFLSKYHHCIMFCVVFSCSGNQARLGRCLPNNSFRPQAGFLTVLGAPPQKALSFSGMTPSFIHIHSILCNSVVSIFI